MSITLTKTKADRVLSYCPDTGVFIWKINTGRAVAGKPAGRYHPDGYWRININRREYLAHRLAWLITSGRWPREQIDHINGVRDDNRLVNLREATHSENAINCGLPKSNKSGVKGVSWNTKKRKWIAQIQINHRKIAIGSFLEKRLAESAYAAKSIELFGEFRRRSA